MFKIEALGWVSFWRALKFETFGWWAGSNLRHQSKNIEIKYKAHIKPLHATWYIHISNPMWRIKNQPSNSTSCSDNALCLLVLVVGRLYWGLQVTSSNPFRFGVAFWKVILREVYFEGPHDRVWRALKTPILNIDPNLGATKHHPSNEVRPGHYFLFPIYKNRI